MALRLHQWETALSTWQFDLKVCDHINATIYRYSLPVDIITWRPQGFAEALLDRLWDLDVPVMNVHSSTYTWMSQHLATDVEVQSVYDPDPKHRHGYGFKGREFTAGTF